VTEMEKETKEIIETNIKEERMDEAWKESHRASERPKLKLSDLDPEIMELITQKVLEKIEAKKIYEEELRWIVEHPEYTW